MTTLKRIAYTFTMQEYRLGYLQKEVIRPKDKEAKIRLLLLQMPSAHFRNDFAEPIGIEQLAGTLCENLVKDDASISIHLGLFRNSNADTLEAVTDEIRKGKFTHVGLSLPLGSLEDGTLLIEGINNLNHELKSSQNKPIDVFVGSHLITGMPKQQLIDLIKRFPFVIAIRGWADKPLLNLMQIATNRINKQPEDISGLVFHDGKEVRVNPLVDDPDFVAGKPIRALTDSTMIANIVDSENCSNPHCTFCVRLPLAKNSREIWRPKPLGQIIEQIADLNRLGINQGSFTGEETLGTTKENAIRQGLNLAEAIISAKKDGLINQDFTFSFSTRSDSIVSLIEADRIDVLKKLLQAGLKRIFLGVETGIPEDFERWDNLPIPNQGKRYGKGISTRGHIRAIETLRVLGIGLDIGFILFDPLLDLGEIAANARFLLDHKLAPYVSNIYNPLRMQSGAKYDSVVEAVLNRLVKEGKIEKKPDLIKNIHPSTLKREYSCLHPLIDKIVNFLSSMNFDGYSTIYALKRYCKSSFITGDPSEEIALDTLSQIRELEVKLMLDIVSWTEEKMKELELNRSEYDQLSPLFDNDLKIKGIRDRYASIHNNIWRNFLKNNIPDYLREIIIAGRETDKKTH